MRRRDVMVALGGAAIAWPLGARAQAPGIPVVGFVADGTPEAWAPRVAGFQRGLSQNGFVDGRNVAIEFRWARGNYDLLRDLTADLVRRQVSVIMTSGSEAVTRAAKAATTTIPIVGAIAGDPVAHGLVASLNRPGGNLTIVSLFTFSNNSLVAKRLELLHQMVPKVTVVGWLPDSNILDYEAQLHDLQGAAQRFGLQVKVAPVARSSDLDAAFATLIQQGAGAILQTGPLIYGQRERVVALAASAAVPMSYEWRDFVDAGGLMSYGSILSEVFRQAGIYVGRILKGEKPADLPVVQPEKFALVLNLKTVKALGLTVPPALIALADDVIE